MARSKKSKSPRNTEVVEVKENPVEAPAPSEDIKLPCLTQEELLRMKLADAEARLARQEGMMAQMAKNAVLAQIDPHGKLRVEEMKITAAKAKEDEAKARYREALSSAAKRLKMDDLAGCAIDQETGAVIRVPQ